MDLLLSLDRAAGRLSAQLAGELRSAVRQGRLVPRTRLPSSRDLARDLGVSRGVVVSAYEQLVAEGFLVSRRGDGTRVAALAVRAPAPEGPEGLAGSSSPSVPSSSSGPSSLSVPSTFSRSPAGPLAGPELTATAVPPPPPPGPWTWHDHDRRGTTAHLYDLRLGVPDLGAFPRGHWSAALRTVLRTAPHDAFGYPDPAGAEVLRVELAAYLGRVRAAQAAPERLTVVAGVAHGLAITARLLAEDGMVLAVEDPAGAHQQRMLEASGVDMVRVPVDAGGIDVAALSRTRARAVLITPAHQFPTGVVLSPRRRAELISWARSADGLVIEDDYDAEFRYDREPVGCLQGVDPGRVVLVGSVSKALAPALRLGWLLAPAALTERVRSYRSVTDLGGPTIEQHALAHLIAGGGYDRHLRTMRRRYRARRDALVGALADWPPGSRVHGVSAGLHLYVELPSGTGEAAVVAAAARHGIAVEGAAAMWSRPVPAPALVLGYAGLGAARLVEAARLLGQVVTEVRAGGRAWARQGRVFDEP